MAKSTYAQRMDEVQALLAPKLKAAGFRQRGRTFNLSEEDGVVQVINLQLWPAPIGGRSLLGDGRYGTFAVNLGVYIAEVYTAKHPRSPSLPKEMDCAIRTRLESLTGKPDFAWSLKGGIADLLKPDLDAVAVAVWGALSTEGLGFLWRFSTRQKIMKDWIGEDRHAHGASRVARLDIAIMLAASGDKAGAADLLDEHIVTVDPAQHNGRHHVEYVRDVAERLGLRGLTAWPPDFGHG